jgi:hypothetical protein
MTVKEIAEAVGKDPATVARWVQSTSLKMQEVSCKVQEARKTSKPADYDLVETCAIIAEGMGEDVANVFRTNAVKAKMETKKPTRLPTASQMTTLERLYGTEGARDRIDFVMGYKEQPKAIEPLALPPPRLSKQAYAVEMKVREREQAKREAERATPKLF